MGLCRCSMKLSIRQFTFLYSFLRYRFVRIQNNKFYKLYNADNSNIESIFPNSKYTDPDAIISIIVSMVIFDKSNNLWLLNMGVSSTVKYMTPDTDGDGPAYGVVKKIAIQ